jgi:alkylglycerol monooxygenase
MIRLRVLPVAIIVFGITLGVYICMSLNGVGFPRHFVKPLPILTAIIVTLVAFLDSKADRRFVSLTLFGLVFALAGDSVILFPVEIFFIIAMVLFLVTHVLYVINFMFVTRISLADVLPGIIVLVPAVLVFILMLPKLLAGTLFIPVLLYTLALCLMVWRALATFRSPVLGKTQAVCISLGAVLFYASDIVLAYNQFVSPVPLYHLINPLLYFPGQLLIAVSTLFFPAGRAK